MQQSINNVPPKLVPGAGETSLCMQCCHHVHMLNTLTTFVEVGMFQIDGVTWQNTLER